MIRLSAKRENAIVDLGSDVAFKELEDGTYIMEQRTAARFGVLLRKRYVLHFYNVPARFVCSFVRECVRAGCKKSQEVFSQLPLKRSIKDARHQFF